MTDAGWTERNFARLVASATALAAVIRCVYVFRDDRRVIGGDGFDYFLSGHRIADGLGYTSAYGDVGAPIAHHPPAWVTLLGVVNWLGANTLRDDQLVGVVIGLCVVVLAGLVGRRYFNARVGVIAAVIAAVYPGFWLLEGNILSEPLDLLVIGLFTLAVIALRDRPTMRRAIVIGALCGLLALVRSEQLALAFIVVTPVLLTARAVTLRRRIALVLVTLAVAAVVIAPWTIYNSTRFKDPVLLSTNDGNLLLLGNCPPNSYQGARLGYYVEGCVYAIAYQHPGLDRSQADSVARHQAVHNIAANLDKLPVAIPARFGRMLAVFRPGQTVKFVAEWMTTRTWLIWAWVLSYLCLLPFAIVGGVGARRERRFLLPFLAPIAIVIVSVAVSYGEPRYHSPSDLGVVVLAAAGIDWVLRRARRPAPQRATTRDEASETRTGDSVPTESSRDVPTASRPR